MDTNNKSVNSTTFDARKAGTNFVLPLTSGTTFAQEGLTKREYFAGLAMQGIISGIFSSKDAYNSFASQTHNISLRIANKSVEYADELLKQLNS